MAELASDEPGVVTAQIDTAACAVARTSIPNLALNAAFDVETITAS